MNGGWRGEKNINTDQSYQEQFKRDEWIKQKALFRNLQLYLGGIEIGLSLDML